ncbi:MAG TPA: GNAT family N-acetyltransferase [Candidatus Dormibacteraeota bacterium]|nr:GNAT family N-acetyltransferase [Candidatus Dormibacteraeota bacterium]
MLAFVQHYRLQLARSADATLLAAMSRQLVETGLPPAWDAGRITWHIRHAESVVLVARSTHAIAGFAIMRYADDSAHLNLLAVDPAHRRRGVARRLVEWLEETALTAGTFRIALELRASNEGARAFYGTLGYRELTQVPGYYQGREAAIRMVRNIAKVTAPDDSEP